MTINDEYIQHIVTTCLSFLYNCRRTLACYFIIFLNGSPLRYYLFFLNLKILEETCTIYKMSEILLHLCTCTLMKVCTKHMNQFNKDVSVTESLSRFLVLNSNVIISVPSNYVISQRLSNFPIKRIVFDFKITMKKKEYITMSDAILLLTRREKTRHCLSSITTLPYFSAKVQRKLQIHMIYGDCKKSNKTCI